VKHVLIFCAALIVSGCAVQSGNQTLSEKSSEDLNSVLLRGKTTREEVQKLFGEPDDTDILSDGRLKWIYTHIKKKAMLRNYVPVVNWFSAGTDDTTRKLLIIFKNGIVDDFSCSSAQGETKGGLFS